MEEINNNNKNDYDITHKTTNTNPNPFQIPNPYVFNIPNNYNIPSPFNYNPQFPNFSNPFIYASYFQPTNIPHGPFNINQSNNIEQKLEFQENEKKNTLKKFKRSKLDNSDEDIDQTNNKKYKKKNK